MRGYGEGCRGALQHRRRPALREHKVKNDAFIWFQQRRYIPVGRDELDVGRLWWLDFGRVASEDVRGLNQFRAGADILLLRRPLLDLRRDRRSGTADEGGLLLLVLGCESRTNSGRVIICCGSGGASIDFGTDSRMNSGRVRRACGSLTFGRVKVASCEFRRPPAECSMSFSTNSWRYCSGQYRD